jgi:poly(hydroxyalkanoate) depolymerase family esterase
MSKQLQDSMSEATRLTNEGRLAEATAAIQHALGGISIPVASEDTDGPEGPVETTGRVLEGATRPSGSANFDQIGDALREALRPSRRYRGVPRLPDGLPSLPNGLSNGLPGLLDGLPISLPDVLPSLPDGLPDLPSGLPGLPNGLPGPTKGVPGPVVVPAGGQFVERSYTGPAGGRSYKLYVPSGYTGQVAVPLVVMLHGCTQNPDDFAAGTSMNELAEEHTFLVAYPAQAQNANVQKCWNWFKSSDQQRGQGEPAMIAGITRQVIEEYEVADGRVYVAGMSAGGAMAAIMGATYPDLYAAVGVHSGLACGAARDLPSAFAAMRQGSGGGPLSTSGRSAIVPTIAFHGDADQTVNPVNGDQVIAQATPAAKLETTVVRGKAPGGASYIRTIRSDGTGRSMLEHWVLQGAGHAWSGGSPDGSYTDPRGPDASREMVRFFLQHSVGT